MNKIIFILLILLTSISLFSQNIKKSSEKVVINGQKYYIHTVEKEQTLYSISNVYNVSITEIEKANPNISSKIKEGQTIKIPIIETSIQESPRNSPTIQYIVKQGDTKYSLCKKYGITIEKFNELNKPFAKTENLKIGSTINLPDIAKEKISSDNIDTSKYICHTVIKGETLYNLSKKYNVSTDDIINNNPKLNNNNLKIGDVIIIPKVSNLLLSRDDKIMDSLSKLNQKQNPKDTTKLNFAACDSINWYKYKVTINISILLPFDKEANFKNLNDTKNKKISLTELSSNIISFYGGCLTAIDNFSDKNVIININTYDIGKKNDILEKLVEEGKFKNNDLIIGPAFKSQAEFLNEKLVNNQVPIILPFLNDGEILRKYPNNIMISPSGYMVRNTISKYLTQITDKNIVIIQGSDAESIKNATEMQRLLKKDSLKNNKIRIVKFDNNINFKNYFDKNQENYVISMISTEAAMNSVFQKLFTFQDYEITFIGEQRIMNYETIDIQYFSKVKFTYFSHINLDYTVPEMKKFLKSYRENFLIEPNDFAVNGYDIINFFVDNIYKYGDKCMDCLVNNFTYKGLSGKMQFSNSKQFSQNSYTNRAVYLYQTQTDYSLKLIYSYTEK
ncbi:MAG: LysM peptidoglycan-binding domain-containing protein [Bacteroidales bacterium]|jgi:LysM repeat protein|nr:LysM peptidoglycan-binding domain-containing protein [Bacteroidales bacterium]